MNRRRLAGENTGLELPVLGAVLLLLLLGLILRRPAELLVHPDTVRDLLQSTAFLGRFPPRLIGPVSSFANLHQGSLWYLYLGLLQGLDLSIEGIRWVTLGFTWAGLAATVLVGRRLFGLAAGVLGGLLAFVLCVMEPGLVDTLWNPVLVLLPAAALVFALARAAGLQTLRAWVLPAVLLSLLAQLHVSAGALLIPALLILFFLGPRPRWRVLALAALAFVGVAVLLSPHAVLLNLREVGDRASDWTAWRVQVLSLPAGLAAGVVFVAAAIVWMVDAGAEMRRAYRALALLGAVGFAVIILGAVAVGRPLQARFVVSLLPGLSVLMGGAVIILFRRAGRLLPAAVSGLLARPVVLLPLLLALVLPVTLYPGLATPLHRDDPTSRNTLTWQDVEEIAAVANDLGIRSFNAALKRLRSPAAGDLFAGLSLHLPHVPGDSDDGERYMVLRAPEEALSGLPPERVTVARRNEKGSLVFLAMDEPLRWAEFRGLNTEDGGAHEMEAPHSVNLSLARHASPGYPALSGWLVCNNVLAWDVWVVASGDDQDRVIVPLCPAYAHNCRSKVSDPEGGGGSRYLLKARSRVELYFKWSFASFPPHQASLLPPILCFPADEPGWEAIIEAMRPL